MSQLVLLLKFWKEYGTVIIEIVVWLINLFSKEDRSLERDRMKLEREEALHALRNERREGREAARKMLEERWMREHAQVEEQVGERIDELRKDPAKLARALVRVAYGKPAVKGGGLRK